MARLLPLRYLRDQTLLQEHGRPTKKRISAGIRSIRIGVMGRTPLFRDCIRNPEFYTSSYTVSTKVEQRHLHPFSGCVAARSKNTEAQRGRLRAASNLAAMSLD